MSLPRFDPTTFRIKFLECYRYAIQLGSDLTGLVWLDVDDVTHIKFGTEFTPASGNGGIHVSPALATLIRTFKSE